MNDHYTRKLLTNSKASDFKEGDKFDRTSDKPERKVVEKQQIAYNSCFDTSP